MEQPLISNKYSPSRNASTRRNVNIYIYVYSSGLNNFFSLVNSFVYNLFGRDRCGNRLGNRLGSGHIQYYICVYSFFSFFLTELGCRIWTSLV